MFIELTVLILVFALALKLHAALTKFRCVSKKCLNGKVAIVTGGNSGMGYEIVRDLASRGCKVIIADITNGEKVAAKIRAETENPNVFWRSIDLGSLSSVREFAEEFHKDEKQLDILINNAGCAGFTGYTEDSLQKVMQVNYFGHFLLIHLLVDMLKKSSDSRIVSVSSALAYSHALNSAELINSEPTFRLFSIDTGLLYSNSKLCVLAANKVLARKLNEYNIRCYSIHPGIVYTPIFRATVNNAKGSVFVALGLFVFNRMYMFIFGKTMEEGAQPTLHCALSKDVEHLSGKYFWDGRVFPDPPIARNTDFCNKLWSESEKLVKLTETEKLL